MRRVQLSILSLVQSGLCRFLPHVRLAALCVLLLSLAVPMLSAQIVSFPDSTIRSTLNTFGRDSIEHLVCLDGRAEGDTVFIEAMRIPEQEQSRTGVVRRGKVGCGASLIVWHNHPVGGVDETPESNLYFSSSDQNTFLRYEEALLAIVATPGYMCLWTRRQVHAGWALNLTPLPAIEKQCWKTDA